jgi:hypothetical protein
MAKASYAKHRKVVGFIRRDFFDQYFSLGLPQSVWEGELDGRYAILYLVIGPVAAKREDQMLFADADQISFHSERAATILKNAELMTMEL